MIRKLMDTARPYIPYTPFAAVAIVMVAIAVVALIRLAAPPQPPLHYTQSEYAAPKGVYLPGETLTISVAISVNHAGIIDVRRGWRMLPSHGWARLCDGTQAAIITVAPPPFSSAAIGQNVGNVVSVKIPNLPPGAYEFISSSRDGAGGEGTFSTRFTIEAPC